MSYTFLALFLVVLVALIYFNDRANKRYIGLLQKALEQSQASLEQSQASLEQSRADLKKTLDALMIARDRSPLFQDEVNQEKEPASSWYPTHKE